MRRDNRMVMLKSMSYKRIMRICYSLMGKINVMVLEHVKHITLFVAYICQFTNTTVVSYINGSLRSETAP